MKINWGVIGCGGIAFRRTIPGLVLSENSNLVAVMDTNFDAAKTVQKEFDAKYAFDNVEDLLAVDEIDAVYIATPVFCHKDQVMKAATAKKHILLEKPMGLTLEDSVEIKEFCEKQGVKLGVGLMMRFNLRLKNLFRGNRSRSEIVATFLAVLELCKTNSVSLEDDVNGDNPNVRLLEVPERKEEPDGI